MSRLHRDEDWPLLEGGQGRSGTDLEAEARALTWFCLVVLVAAAVAGWAA